jgi:hypothetical protein
MPPVWIVSITTRAWFARAITFANWPRWVDPKAAGAKPYPGWPITVRQEARQP